MRNILIGLSMFLLPLNAFASHGGADVPASPWIIIPFLLLLLAIAILPLKTPHFWERNQNKALVTALISLPTLVYYLLYAPDAIPHQMLEYFSFIVLLWSLYTISGGVLLKGNLVATPGVNTIFLAIGAIAANIFGTTGASMLLIRPLLQANMERKHKKHTFIFFIFVVANMGGCLTPLGDPPLYMGFLKGIPFHWTLRLWPQWLFMNSILLLIYYLWDRRTIKKEAPEDLEQDLLNREPLRIEGWVNFALIGGVLATIVAGVGTPWREAIMITLGLLSMWATPKRIRTANFFNFNAITEVAVLFLGIFITMIPALILLGRQGASLGVTEPWHFFWITGVLSSFLDNTPTYLTFLSLAQGVFGVENAADLLNKVSGEAILVAISLGAVFMGANTYIGNGPNFMVKAIAEEKGPTYVEMPSFGGYMLYSLCILMPLMVIVTLIFF